MKNLCSHSLRSGKFLAAATLAASLLAASGVQAQFIPTGAGSYSYTDTNNWTGGNINNTFASTRNPTADQTIYFDGNLTLSSGWTINDTSTFNRRFIGSGADRTITLGGNISLGSSSTNPNTLTMGSATAGQALNIDLGPTSRTIAVGTNRTLEMVNIISGGGGLTKTGAGILKLTGTANTFTGNIALGASGAFGGVLEVTKLADSGVTSSIGAGNAITFGGADGAATLRYVGSGDSSNRSFTIGSQGAIFDASGSDAINFTNTGNIDVSPSNSVSRSLSFTGTNAGDNSFASVIRNPSASAVTSVVKDGSGKWILAGANTYTGVTIVIAGTLLVNGSIVSATQVNGGLFGGNGTAGVVDVNDAGAISAGNGGIATLTTGSLNLNDSAEFVFEYNIVSASSVTADLINSGAFNLDMDNTAVLTLNNLGLDLALNVGTVLTLVDYTTWNGGRFAGYADDSQFTVGANTFQISYNGVSGSDSAVTLEVVPEPSTVALVGLASVLFWARRRKM
jgi:fibronectin-binding autotransporter adhesin